MPLSRRQFLTALAAVPAVAKIAPFLLKELASPSVEGVAGPLGHGQSSLSTELKFSDLESAYQQLCYGAAEPDLIVMSPDTYASFMDWWTKMPLASRFLLPDNEVSTPYFEGAAVSYSKALERGTIALINSKPPSQEPERYSGLFRRGWNTGRWNLEPLENLPSI